MTDIRFLLLLLSLLTTGKLEAQHRSTAVIRCYIGNTSAHDTLRLEVWNENLSTANFRDLPSRNFVAANNKGVFRFTIDSLDHPVYFSLSKDRNTIIAGYFPFIANYLLEPGDNLTIRLDSLNPIRTHFFEFKDDILTGYRFIHPSFTGEGAARTECRYLLDRSVLRWMQIKGARPSMIGSNKRDTAYYATLPGVLNKVLDDNASMLAYQLGILDAYRTKMSATACQIMYANVVGNMETIQLILFASLRNAPRYDSTVSPDYKKDFTASMRTVYDARRKVDMSAIPDSLLTWSTGYLGFLAQYANFGTDEKYYYLTKNYKGILRDRLIADFFLSYVFFLKNNNDLLTDAVSVVQDRFASKLMTKIYNTQRVGSEAYNFSLSDVNGRTVKLSDFKGKIVFIDLWYTGCGACQGFYKYQLSRVEENFRDNPDVVFITVSIDTHKDQWINSVKTGTYSSPAISNVVNLYTNGEGADHAMIKQYNVKGYPHPFMVDRQGLIYKINELQTTAEILIPVINEAISRHGPS